MTSPYPEYGSRPGNSYPNASPQGRPAPYDRAVNASMDSEMNEDVYKHQNLGSNYSQVPSVRVDPARSLARTPSPTPSEQTELSKKQLFDFDAMKHKSYWFRREWLCAYLRVSSPTDIAVLMDGLHTQGTMLLASWSLSRLLSSLSSTNKS